MSGTAGPIITKFVAQIPCGCGSVLLWRRCDTLSTSGFMNDVTFGRSGPYGDSGSAIPGAESDVYECLVLSVVTRIQLVNSHAISTVLLHTAHTKHANSYTRLPVQLLKVWFQLTAAKMINRCPIQAMFGVHISELI